MQKSCACKFLFGKDTTQEKIDEIQNVLENKVEYKTEAIFQKKDASPFWCLLDIVPIKNEKAEVVLFLASHKDITKSKTMNSVNGHTGDEEEDDDENDSDGYETNDNYLSDLPTNYNYARRRSRAVLYHLSGHLKDQEKKKRRKLKLNSQSLLAGPKRAVLPEYKVAAMKKSRFIILHYSTFKSIWDWLVLVATLYIAIVVPYNVAVGPEKHTVTTVLDIMVEVLFLTDIGINFTTTFVSKTGVVVYERRAIAIHYAKTWFFIDILAAVPFDFIVTVSNINTVSTIQLLKLARLLRLLRLLQKIERYSQYSAITLTFLMLAFALLAHWLGCVWYGIGMTERENPNTWNLGWINNLGEDLHRPLEKNNSRSGPRNESKYITSLYFTLSSLTSVGFGNVSANTDVEKIFTIIVMLIGALCHAAVFGNVTAIVQRMYSRRALYHLKLRDLKDFVTSHHIPANLKTRMNEYFNTSWSNNMGIDTMEMLHRFPEELRADVTMHLHKEFLQLPIFGEASQGCLRSLSLRVKTGFCAPGEYILHQGDSLISLYFLLNGSMEILRQGMVVAILGKGDLFGCDLYDTETCIQSSGDVHALTYCDLMLVSRHELQEVLHNYPEYMSKFKDEISRDLTFNLREGADQDPDPFAAGFESNRPSRLTSISELQDEEEDEAAAAEKAKDVENRSVGTETIEMMALDRSKHMLLDVSSSVGSGVPPDLSPRIVDGVEDSSNQYKANRFDFPGPCHQQASRHHSLTSAPRQRLINHYNSGMRQSFTSPQLARGINFSRSRSVSSESICTDDLKHEIEYTRNSVERLDRQVSNLSKDVSSLSQDLKAVVRLLQVISPANTVSPNPSGVNGPNSSPTLSHTGRLSPRLPAPKTAPKETRFEDIVHVQRRDGVLETSLGSGILETSLSGGLPSTIQCEEKLPSCSSSLQSLTGATLKHEGPMRETNIILFQDTEPTDQVQDTKRDLFDFDSEGGTDL
ncbi:potassium voltage-gated channel subfamily H member 8-like isoform X1 [Asterias rubens]|uniref:potassium voltage-gated channel subfamily H member 8-like isoform X1 n=1 Tax=Asterias rubens TaxID=7604 RepID=UPI0014559F23|nr:potassium voltage-gated channel subfamily H member 8-like isoform X1 [Asterias rubens]